MGPSSDTLTASAGPVSAIVCFQSSRFHSAQSTACAGRHTGLSPVLLCLSNESRYGADHRRTM